MRRLTTAVFSLLLLVSMAAAARAQSGRNRNVPVEGGGANRPTANDSKGDEPAAAAEPEEVEGEVVSVNTSLVTIPVSVRDRQGRYAPDLRREDFRVYENGVEQRVAYFAAVDQPFTVALVLDTSGSTEFSVGDMQRAALAFVAQLKAADRVTVISFDDHISVLCEPTSDRAQLERAIRRARGGGGTRLYDAVEYTLRKKLAGVEGRKAVVLLSDGVDTMSHASYSGSIRTAEESDALIYTVSYGGFRGGLPGVMTQPRIPLPGGGGIVLGGPGSNGTSAADIARGEAYLNELAVTAGGRMYRGNSVVNVSQAFEWVAEELRRQYSLGYYPKTAGKNGERRQIKVEVTRPNLAVRARDSYVFKPRPEEKGAGGDGPKGQESKPRRLDGGR